MLLAACTHGEPYGITPPGTQGPFTDTLPRRLTFYPLDDVMPSVLGAVLVFSRQSAAEPSPYSPYGREQCLAFMPLEGGTITRELCPRRLLPPDTLVDDWLEPSLSPDGARLAYAWQRDTRIGALGYQDLYLMVTPATDPTDTTIFRELVRYVEIGPQNPRRADLATHITWLDGNRLRFLATYEHIDKVKGGGASRVTDTTWEPLALMEANVQLRTLHVVPGGDSVIAYSAAPGGGIWVVKAASSDTLRLLDPVAGGHTVVGTFSGNVADLVTLDGDPVAVVDSFTVIERLHLATATRTSITGFGGPVRRIVPAGPGRVVAQIDAGVDVFGLPGDLWLVAVP